MVKEVDFSYNKIDFGTDFRWFPLELGGTLG